MRRLPDARSNSPRSRALDCFWLMRSRACPCLMPKLFSLCKNDDASARVLVADAAVFLERLAASADIPAEVRVEPGKADQVIDQLTCDADSDLRIIGPGKPQNLRERLWGSTADRVVRSGLCPILIVKREWGQGIQSRSAENSVNVRRDRRPREGRRAPGGLPSARRPRHVGGPHNGCRGRPVPWEPYGRLRWH